MAGLSLLTRGPPPGLHTHATVQGARIGRYAILAESPLHRSNGQICDLSMMQMSTRVQSPDLSWLQRSEAQAPELSDMHESVVHELELSDVQESLVHRPEASDKQVSLSQYPELSFEH